MGAAMKRIAVGTAVILAILSLAACAQTGKGKTPPPVVTKG
jgi:predicted small secreted protein